MPLPENEVAQKDKAITDGDHMIADGLQMEINVLGDMHNVLNNIESSIGSLVDMFGNFLEKQKFLLDAEKEKKDVKDVSGASEKSDDTLLGGLSAEDLKMGTFSKLFLGAIALYATGLDKYIRAVALPSTLKSLKFGFLKPFGFLFKELGKGFRLGRYTKSLKGVDKSIVKRVKNIKSLQFRIGATIGGIVQSIKNFLTGIKTYFTNIGKNITKTTGQFKLPKLNLARAIRFVTAPFRGFIRLLDSFGGVFTQIGNLAIPLTKSGTQAMKGSGGLLKTLSGFGGMFRGVFTILRHTVLKVLAPLFALFDLITGFIEGFKLKGDEDTRGTLERVFDGVVAGIIKAFKGMVIIPLDLIRKGAAWLAEKMGMDWIADALGSFSFEDSFDFIIKFITNWFAREPEEGYFSIVKLLFDIIGGIVEGWKAFKDPDIDFSLWLNEKIKGIVDMIKSFLANMLDKATFGLFGKDDPEKELSKLDAKKADLDAEIAEHEKQIAAGKNTYGFNQSREKEIEKLKRKKAKLDVEQLELINKEKAKNNELMLEQNNVNQSSLELNKRTEDVAAQKDENINGGRGGVIADVGNVTDASTNVNNVSHNYSPGPPSARADMSDNPMMAWKTA